MEIKSGSGVIDNGLIKEIGVDIDKAIEILSDSGVTKDDMVTIIEKFEDMSDEIDRRGIPYECRFFLINIIFHTLFKTNQNVRGRFAMIIEDMKNKRSV